MTDRAVSSQAQVVSGALEQALRALAELAVTLRELQRQVAALPLDEGSGLPVCPVCGVMRLPTETTLPEHIENVHGGAKE